MPEAFVQSRYTETPIWSTLGADALSIRPAQGGQRRRRRSVLEPVGVIGAVIVATYLCCALLGESIAPYPFTEQHLSEVLQAPSLHHVFGTDQLGRDVFSRVIVGARTIMLLSCLVTALSLLLGVSVGLVVGYSGGIVDEVLMRLMDLMLAFPGLLLAMLVISVLGSNLLEPDWMHSCASYA